MFAGIVRFVGAENQIYALARCEAKVRFIDKASDQRVIGALLKHGALEDKAGALEGSRVVEGRTWRRTLKFFFAPAPVQEQRDRVRAIERELVGLEPSCRLEEPDLEASAGGKRLAALRGELKALDKALDDKPVVSSLAQGELRRLEGEKERIAVELRVSLTGELPAVR